MTRTIPAFLMAMLVSSLAWGAKGKLQIEITTASGARCPADIEIRQAGKSAIVKTVSAASGEGEASLDPGRYDVAVVAKGTGHKGEKKNVEVRSGATTRYGVTAAVAPASSTPAPAASPEPTIKGEVVRESGAAMDGTVVLYLESGTAEVEKGRFTISNVKRGKYRVEFRDKAGKKLGSESLTVGAGPATVTLKVP
ncbi:MAG: carboxypeptidase-like regulatory domain-containing protein [Myxococcota bacterium]